MALGRYMDSAMFKFFPIFFRNKICVSVVSCSCGSILGLMDVFAVCENIIGPIGIDFSAL